MRGFMPREMGRPSLAAGRYFRLLLIGYFEGIDSANAGLRGGQPIRWRCASFLRVGTGRDAARSLDDLAHAAVDRLWRRIRRCSSWVLRQLAEAGLLKGKTIGVDATTLEANAALRSIVRRDTGEGYQEFLVRLAQESGIRTPTREQLARLDRKRAHKGSNQDWVNPHDPDARITKMKDGRTHLAHKAEQAVDLETGAVVAVCWRRPTRATLRRF